MNQFSELTEKINQKKAQMFGIAWIADYPDGENFLQLFTTKSIGGANYTMFSRPDYDAMYEQSKSMPDSASRVLRWSGFRTPPCARPTRA